MLAANFKAENFSSAIKKLAPLTGKAQNQILNNVLIKPFNGKFLLLTTSNTEKTLTTAIPAKIESPGDITLPAKRAFEISSKLNAEINVKTNEKHNSYWSSGSFNAMLPGLAAKNFPEDLFKAETSFEIKTSQLKELITKTIFCASDAKQQINGIHIEITANIIRSVATDGKTLGLCETKHNSKIEKDITINLPKKDLTTFIGMFDSENLIMETNLKECRIKSSNLIFKTKLSSLTYPDYKKVIPESFKTILKIPTKLLMEKINLVNAANSNGKEEITLNFNEKKLEIKNEKANDFIDLDQDAGNEKIRLNPQYLINPLTGISEETLEFKFNDSATPIQINETNTKYIIMPLR